MSKAEVTQALNIALYNQENKDEEWQFETIYYINYFIIVISGIRISFQKTDKPFSDSFPFLRGYKII